MKKIYAFLCVILTAVFVLSGCSCDACSNTSPLSITANWMSSKKYETPFTETLTYSVNYLPSFSESGYSIKEKESDKYSVTFSQGEYVTKVRAINGQESDVVESAKDVLKAKGPTLYELSTTFSIPVTYSITGADGDMEFTDTITSVVYFKSNSDSLTPIYSEKFYDTTSIYKTTKSTYVGRYQYFTKINYNDKDKAVLEIKNNITTTKEDSDFYKTLKVDEAKKTIEYTPKSTFDNEQLFFVIRGLNISKDFTSSLNIIDTSYKSVQQVSVTVEKEVTLSNEWSIQVGSNAPIEYGADVPTETLLTLINRYDSQFKGAPKFCYYQKQNATGTNKYYLVKMVNSLVSGLGVLEFNLNSVTVNV